MKRSADLFASLVVSLALVACESPGSSPPSCQAPPPPIGEVAVVINEFMAINALTLSDEAGKSSDWVELYNPGDTAVSLCGFGLTDDLSIAAKGYLGPDAVLAAKGHLLVWTSGRGEVEGAHHVPFKLSGDGGELGVSHPSGEFVARLVFGAQATDFSAAREPDGSDLWITEWHPSPGEANPAGAGSPLEPRQSMLAPEEVPAVGDLSDEIMGYEVLLELALKVAPDEVAKLKAEPRTYVRASLEYRGRTYGPVGLRLKGNNSFRPFDEKPSFRINIDEFVDGAKFFQLDDLTLNNMDDDFSMMHERLSYLLARAIGPASRANHAVLTVNGKAYGLYANVETVKKRLLARWFEDPEGSLFEATHVDFAPIYVDAFELESGPDDRSKLQAVADALTLADPTAAIAAAAAHVDLEAFLRFWAMEAVVGQFDAFPYSDPGDDYFVYVDPVSERLWFLPWGMDETFYAGADDIKLVVSLLTKTCLAAPSCYQAFVAAVWAVQATAEDLDLLGERLRVMEQIAPHVAADRRKPYTDAVVAEFQENLYWFLYERRTHLEAMLGPAQP